MLQDIRANAQGTIAKIIIGLIVISFSIFGIESLLFSGGGNAVAEVNGEEIGPFALQQEVSLQQRRLLAMLGDAADPALLDEDRLREQALQALIQRRLLAQSAADMGLAVADAALGQIIGGMPQFQVDGRFSPDLYRSTLSTLGFTPVMFRERLEEDLLLGQLRAVLAGSAFATGDELAVAARIAQERRDLRYVTLPLERFRDAVQLDDTALRAYYEANGERYMTDESVVVDYLELTLDDYREPVDEARLREEFELVRDQYQQAEESRVSHILLDGDNIAARLAEVQEALAGGMEFAEAAGRFSDDVGSREAGGDLGYTAGDTFPAPMEAAIAELPVGVVSDPVETGAGTHLLLVTDRREGTAVTLDDVRLELSQRLEEADASAALLRDVEELRDLAFNAADLQNPAQALSRSFEVQRSEPITRDQQDGLFASPRLLDAAFSADVLEGGHNSAVIELDPAHFVVLRVAERRPPVLQPFEAVRGDIVATLRDEEARTAARDTARGLLRDLRAGEGSVESLANAAQLDWQVELGARRDSARLPRAVRDRLFSLPQPEDEQPVRDLVSDVDSLYVLELTRVSPGGLEDMTDDQREGLRRRLASENGGLQQQLYEESLRRDADITVY